MELYILSSGIFLGVILGHYLDKIKDFLDNIFNKGVSNGENTK